MHVISNPTYGDEPREPPPVAGANKGTELEMSLMKGEGEEDAAAADPKGTTWPDLYPGMQKWLGDPPALRARHKYSSNVVKSVRVRVS